MPHVVVDLETTGLAARTDRVVEIALVRVENGAVVDEWATIVDPGCDPGPTWIHEITHEHITGAPTFQDIAGDVLARLDQAVVVAHNATFEEGFLLAEFTRIGLALPRLPALCTLTLSRSVLAAPNYRLGTCCQVSGVDLSDAHTALGDTRATARLLPHLLRKARGLRYPHLPPPLPRLRCTARPRTRASQLRKGHDGWLRSLLTKLPYSMADAEPAAADAYLTVVGDALADGKLTGHEARQLARLAGAAGLGAEQVRALNRRFLDGLRDAALADDVLTASEYRQLTTAAALLDEPQYFTDLTPTTVKPDRIIATRTQGPRAWFSSAVPSHIRNHVTNAGYTLAANITRSLAIAVVADTDRGHPKSARAAALGITILTPAEAQELESSSTNPAATPAPAETRTPPVTAAPGLPRTEPLAPPLPPAGWYQDPTGSSPYRHWNGLTWTEHISYGDSLTWIHTPWLPTGHQLTLDGLVDGQPPSAHVDHIKHLAVTDASAALTLVYRCIDATENEARRTGNPVAPWFYEQAANIHAKHSDQAAELSVLERFARQRHGPGNSPARLLGRVATHLGGTQGQREI